MIAFVYKHANLGRIPTQIGLFFSKNICLHSMSSYNFAFLDLTYASN